MTQVGREPIGPGRPLPAEPRMGFPRGSGDDAPVGSRTPALTPSEGASRPTLSPADRAELRRRIDAHMRARLFTVDAAGRTVLRGVYKRRTW